MYRSVLLLSACALLSSCNGKDPEPEPSPLLDVEASATWQLSGLHGAGHIVYTEFGVPHIYAVDRHDLAMLWGYQAARDRYFMMDLSRRLALGEVSELLGRDALSSDMGSRAEGNRHIAERMLAQIEENDPDLVEIVDAYAAGVNAYIAAVEVGRLPPPSELVVAKALLGAQSEVELMKPFDRLSVVAGISTVIAQSAFEGGDVNRGFSERRLDTLYAGFDHPELRQSGMRPDLWDRPEPVFAVASAPDWDFDEDHTGRRRSLQGTATAPVETQVVKRLLAQRARWDRLRGHDWEHGWGSNAWAVSGDATTDGRSLLASDGHLSLTIPSLFYQVGLDTQHLGSDDLSFIGMVVPGLPVPGPGTNGHVAWSQIAFFGDVTDWYREEIGLDSNGLPATSVFKGQDKPLLANEEVYQIADVPLLDSVGGTDKWTRWTTFDGRWITSIEGTVVEAGTEPPSGKSVVAVGERFVIPEDLDHDGVITALSFDYAPLDGSTALRAMWDFADSKNVDDYREASRGLVGNSAGLIVADTEGSIYYTGYQAVPCREHLPRNVDGHFIEGADPTLLIDGTIYGGFTIPFKDGVVDESQTDPDKCLVPFAEYPNSKNPAQNYLVAANNDPAGYTFDGDIFNEPTYIGGPWIEGYRADTIARELKAVADDASADLDGMQRLQGNHDSRLGEQFLPYLIDALERGRELQESEPDNLAEIRMRAWYGINKERFDAVQTRLTSWGQGGFQARSGVETFYDPVLDGDLEDSVATMIFNTWYGRFLGMVLRD
ncbi:MAG: penicillin amidase, partial [Kiritimatiellia bacterium]